MDGSIECPYCGYENKITSDDHEVSNEFDKVCENCEEEFEVTTTWYPIYSADKIEYKNCIDCGKEYRVEGKSYPKPSKYKDVKSKDYCVCNSCYAREVLKDFGG